jgi:hypothetical protein
MKTSNCTRTRRSLGAYVDHELPGAEMLEVSAHLASCAACAEEADALRIVGQLLRGAAERRPTPIEAGRVAHGVLERVRAERAVSWPALFRHGFGDWRWTVVGTGSLAATSVSTLLVAAVLAFGPAPERVDSLAALISNLGTPTGLLLLEARSTGGGADAMLFEVDSGARPQSLARDDDVMPVVFRLAEQQLVGALTDAVTREGRLVELGSMPDSERRNAEALLDAISRLRSAEPAFGSSGSLAVSKVRFVTSTGVTAKGL